MSDFLYSAKSFLEGQLDGEKYAKKYLNNIAEYLDNINDTKVSITGNTANIGFKVMQNQADDNNDSRSQISFIDMKPYFQRSSKAKRKKDGGWYLTIPIQGKTTQLRSAYSRSVWDQISHTEYGTTSNGNVDPSVIQNKLGTSQDNVNNGLKYAWKSSNITRVPWGKSGKRAHYISFRTVSSSSPASSWLIGRKNFTTNIVPNKYANQIAQIIKNHVLAE